MPRARKPPNGRAAGLRASPGGRFPPGGVEEGELLYDVFELPDIAGPSVELHGASRLLGEGDGGSQVFFGEIGCKFSGEQDDVVATVVEGGDIDDHG